MNTSQTFSIAPTEQVQAQALTRDAILHGAILATLLKLSIPTMLVLIAQIAVHVAEAVYVGRLGTAPLAGVALVFPLFMLMMTMSNSGIGSGVASAMARAIGGGRKDDANAIVFYAVMLAFAFGLVFTAGALIFGPWLYRAMGGEGEALDAASHYSAWLFAGAIPVWLVNLLASALRGAGNVKVPAMVTLSGALILIPTSPILIFGLGPIPALGIAGAGISFGLYYTLASLALLRYMASGRSGLTLKRNVFDARHLRGILKVGVPVALSTLQTNLTVIIVTSAVGFFGTQAIAGYGNASRLDFVMIPLLFGFATAVLTMVGVNVGAGQVMRAKRIAWVGGLVGAVLTGSVGIAAALFPHVWLGLFSNDPAVLEPAIVYLHIVAPFYGVFGLGFVLGFAAQGAGQGKWSFMGATARMLIAAGVGWVCVAYFYVGMSTLAAIVAASYVASALVCGAAMFSQSAWRSGSD